MATTNHIRLFITLLAALALALSLAIVGTAAHTLHVYTSQRELNPLWLPPWPEHFDDRDLRTLVGGGVVVVVLDAAIVATQVLAIEAHAALLALLPLLALAVAVVDLALPAVLNARAPARDTVYTWTCGWSGAVQPVSNGISSDFGALCSESKFAFWATVPVLVAQLLILVLVVLGARNMRVATEMSGWTKEDRRALHERKRPVEDVRYISSSEGP